MGSLSTPLLVVVFVVVLARCRRAADDGHRGRSLIAQPKRTCLCLEIDSMAPAAVYACTVALAKVT